MNKQQYAESIQDSQDLLDDISEENKAKKLDLPFEEAVNLALELLNRGANLSETKDNVVDFFTSWMIENKISEIGLQSAIVQKQAIQTVIKWSE